MNIGVHVSLSILVSLVCMPSSGIAGQFYLQFFKDSPHCSPQWLYQFAFPPTFLLKTQYVGMLCQVLKYTDEADMISISMELIVQLPDRSTFYHPRKKNLSRLFLKQQFYKDPIISPFLLSSHLLVKQSTLSWILIISVAQIFPSKPININIMSKGTWLTTDSSISILRYS